MSQKEIQVAAIAVAVAKIASLYPFLGAIPHPLVRAEAHLHRKALMEEVAAMMILALFEH